MSIYNTFLTEYITPVKIITPIYMAVYTTEYDSNNSYVNFSKLKSTIAEKGFCEIYVKNRNGDEKYKIKNIRKLSESDYLYGININSLPKLNLRCIMNYNCTRNNNTIVISLYRDKVL